MQTFLPYKSFIKTAKCLDNKRLGKQRVEARSILNILEGKVKLNRYGKIPWVNHPAVKMWAGYENCLKLYLNFMIEEWENRGFRNNIDKEKINILEIKCPPWLGDKKFHDSHKSKLLEKDVKFYSKYGWKVKVGLPYLWPTKEKKI